MAVGNYCISVRVPIWNALLSSIVGGGFNEWFENGIRLSEVVVDNVHEE